MHIEIESNRNKQINNNNSNNTMSAFDNITIPLNQRQKFFRSKSGQKFNHKAGITGFQNQTISGKAHKPKIRAFDKENLLDQLQKEQKRNMQVLEQNSFLKDQLSRQKDRKKNWSQNQVRLIIESLKIQNEELNKKLKQKNGQVEEQKRRKASTDYFELLTYYSACCEEMKRLKVSLKKKSRERRAVRKQRKEIRSLIHQKNSGLIAELEERMMENSELENDFYESQAHLKEATFKFYSKQRSRAKLMEEIQILKAQLGNMPQTANSKINSHSNPSQLTINHVYGYQNFKRSVKTQSSKVLPKVTEIPDEELEHSALQEKKYNKIISEHSQQSSKLEEKGEGSGEENYDEDYADEDSDEEDYSDENYEHYDELEAGEDDGYCDISDRIQASKMRFCDDNDDDVQFL